jgi:hypothetical protein
MTHSQIPDDLRRNALALVSELRHEADQVYISYMDRFRNEWHDLLGFHFVMEQYWENAFRDAIQAEIPTEELVWMFVKAMKLTVPNSTA